MNPAVHEYMTDPENSTQQKQIKFNTGNNQWEYTGLTRPSTTPGIERRGGGRKSRRNARARRNSKKQKRVRHTRRKQTRRHRHSRRR